MTRFIIATLTMLMSTAALASTNLGFVSEPGDYIGQGQVRDYDENNARFNYSVSPDFSTIRVSLDSADGSEWWTLSIDGPNGVPLAIGRYADATRKRDRTSNDPAAGEPGGA